jgi:hypothetical protein
MRNATRVMVSTFGAFVGLIGIEHGLGEALQGNVAPDGIMILSWPKSALFSILAGEPAMTIIPNLLTTGILAILFSLIYLAWAILFVQRKNGGLILMLLSVVMLLAGGGIFPPNPWHAHWRRGNPDQYAIDLVAHTSLGKLAACP